MGFPALAAIIIVSIAVGVAVQIIAKKDGPTWLVIAATGAFGAYFASETFPGSTVFQFIKDWGLEVDGFFVIPGVVTGAIVALVAYVGTRHLETSTTVTA